MNLAVFSLIGLLLSCVNQGQAKAVLQNGTMRYYVFPMENWEVEALQRQSRQQQGTVTGTPSTGNAENDGTLPIAGTATNVVNILHGLFNQDVRPILVGSTAFIPPGDLREGVSGLLLGLAPNIQHLLFGNPRLPPTYTTIMTRQPLPRPQPPPIPQRPQLVRATTTIPESPPVAVTVAVVPQTPAPTPKDISEEETDSPLTAPPLPPPTSARPSTTTSAESEEEPEDPVAALSTSAPSSATSDPSEATDPETEKVTAIVPESSQSTPANVPETQPQKEATTTTTKPTSPTVAELKVVFEDTNANSIVTANVASNSTGDSKQYFYLVLLPEEYDQLTKLEEMSKNQKPQEDLESERGIQEETEMPASPPSTLRTSRPRNRNRNRSRTTTVPPLHLQLNYYYQMTSTSPSTTTTTTTTTNKPSSSTDLPGVQGFQNEDDEIEPKITIY